MKRARYQAQVSQCAAEIKGLLPDLASRHTPLVVIAALSEHVGGALFLSRETRACSPAQARAIIQRMKELAFADEPA